MFARLLIVICFRCKDRACEHLCVSNSRNESDGRLCVDNPGIIFDHGVFLEFSFLSPLLLFHADPRNEAVASQGKDISVFVFSNLQHLLLLTIFIHASIFKRSSFLRAINSAVPSNFYDFWSRVESYYYL